MKKLPPKSILKPVLMEVSGKKSIKQNDEKRFSKVIEVLGKVSHLKKFHLISDVFSCEFDNVDIKSINIEENDVAVISILLKSSYGWLKLLYADLKEPFPHVYDDVFNEVAKMNKINVTFGTVFVGKTRDINCPLKAFAVSKREIKHPNPLKPTLNLELLKDGEWRLVVNGNKPMNHVQWTDTIVIDDENGTNELVETEPSLPNQSVTTFGSREPSHTGTKPMSAFQREESVTRSQIGSTVPEKAAGVTSKYFIRKIDC